MEYRAITVRGLTPGLLRAITSDVVVTTPFAPPAMPGTVPSVTVKGLWDTGVSNSVITKKVADALGIEPVGRTMVTTAGGQREANVYLVNLGLPGNVVFAAARVTEGLLTGVDVLIGMDIITTGDFAITNKDGNTVATFRHPSCQEIDYVKQIEQVGRQGAIDSYLPGQQKKRRR